MIAPDGTVIIREYEIVRIIARKLDKKLAGTGIRYKMMNADSDVDILLKTRVQYVDFLHADAQDVVYVPLHINAKGRGRKWHNDARGVRVLHYGESTAEMARVMAEAFTAKTQFDDAYEKRNGFFRSVVRPSLYELRKPKCKVIYPEMGFMTSEYDAYYLLSEEGQDDCAEALVEFTMRAGGLL
jgi:N-acetylmuramoyl-L-alanine amidase